MRRAALFVVAAAGYNLAAVLCAAVVFYAIELNIAVALDVRDGTG